jgi:hypothetical protein
MSRSQFHSIKMFILRHAWLNLWDKHMTTGRINQVTLLSVTTPNTASAPPSRRWSVEFGVEDSHKHDQAGIKPERPCRRISLSHNVDVQEGVQKFVFFQVVTIHSTNGEHVLPSIFGFLVSFLPTPSVQSNSEAWLKTMNAALRRGQLDVGYDCMWSSSTRGERLAARASTNGLELVCLPIGYAYRPFLSPSEHAVDLEGR